MIHWLKNKTVDQMCKHCEHFDILNDPNIPEVSGLCLSEEVLNLKMQPEPHPDFGCKFFKVKDTDKK